MSIFLKIQVEARHLNIVATGEFSLDEAKRTFLQMLEAVALHQTNKVLMDGRRLIGNPTAIERFYYGEFAAHSVAEFWENGIPHPQFAYVLREPVLDPNRLGETVAVNRGVNAKAFDGLAEALQWLGIASANKPYDGCDNRRHM